MTWDDFLVEASDFREAMGQRSVMTDPEARNRALMGFMHASFQCRDDRVRTVAASHAIDYTRRCAWLDAY